MDGAETEDALAQRAAQAQIHDAVESYFFFLFVQKALFNIELFPGKPILGECPGQTKNNTFAILPDKFSFSHICTSLEWFNRIFLPSGR